MLRYALLTACLFFMSTLFNAQLGFTLKQQIICVVLRGLAYTLMLIMWLKPNLDGQFLLSAALYCFPLLLQLASFIFSRKHSPNRGVENIVQ